jgi:predicted nucleotidyltransferase
MKSDVVIAVLRQHEDKIRSFGASALYLYGSTRHDTARPDSDVDLFLDRDPERPFGFLELTGLEAFLEDLLETRVDLATRSSLHPALKAAIERDAVRVV